MSRFVSLLRKASARHRWQLVNELNVFTFVHSRLRCNCTIYLESRNFVLQLTSTRGRADVRSAIAAFVWRPDRSLTQIQPWAFDGKLVVEDRYRAVRSKHVPLPSRSARVDAAGSR